MGGKPSADGVLCKYGFFVLQRPKFGNDLYIYRETIAKIAWGVTVSALRIGNKNAPSICRKYQDEQVSVTTAKGYSCVGILVVRVYVFQ